MNLLIPRAFSLLFRFDIYIRSGDFQTLYDAVRCFPIGGVQTGALQPEDVCRAVNVAAIWYYKPVLCLQRSAAATCLLRKCGINSHLVLGAQQIPFRAHAWVEVAGRVVNDKTYVTEIYSVLDRC